MNRQKNLVFKTIKKKDINDLNEDDILKSYCFAQGGEDYLVNFIFENKSSGIYLDIGGHDGIRFSNSFAFSKLGWKGIIVEAHPDYYKICYDKRNNEFTKIYNVACSNTDSEEITFYTNYRGSLSTLNHRLNDTYKRDYKGYYKDMNYTNKIQNFTNGPIKIKSRKIDTIIEENFDFFETKEIDLISIDVDGSEELTLGGFDILKYRPRVLIVEVSVVRHIVEKYMSDKGYVKVYGTNLNSIYVRDEKDVIKFKNKIACYKKIYQPHEKGSNSLSETIILYDTLHPLD